MSCLDDSFTLDTVSVVSKLPGRPPGSRGSADRREIRSMIVNGADNARRAAGMVGNRPSERPSQLGPELAFLRGGDDAGGGSPVSPLTPFACRRDRRWGGS